MKIIINGEAIEIPVSAGVTMEQVNEAISAANTGNGGITMEQVNEAIEAAVTGAIGEAY